MEGSTFTPRDEHSMDDDVSRSAFAIPAN